MFTYIYILYLKLAGIVTCTVCCDSTTVGLVIAIFA